MSNTSTNQVIALPTGGGAISGVGEKFAPDLHTGTGNFTIPLALPPGRNGFQPELNLVYSTGTGNGPFGLGWTLGTPGISRKTSKGVPRYDDKHDVFILSGLEDLVPVETREIETRFRPRTEGLFARIVHHRDDDNNYWEVQSKDGLKSLYGTPGAVGADPATVADPAVPTNIFAWKLSRTVDPFGNRIEYEYERDTAEDGPHRWDQLYLQRIRYVDYADQTTGQEHFLVSVRLDYGDPDEERPDPFSTYRAGFEIRTRRRCRRILIETHAPDEQLTRTYELRYLDERVRAGEQPISTLPHNGVSLLNQVSVIGHDGDRTEALPPVEFGYTQFEPVGREFRSLSERHLPAQSLASPDLTLVDLFGNGLPDFLQMNGTVRYWRNLGDGTFDLPRDMPDAPSRLRLADAGVQLLDANGDGRIDLMMSTNDLAGYFPLRFDGRWDRRSFQRYRQAPSVNLEDPEVHLVDLDGDGVTDAIRSGTRLECFFNDAQEGWTETRRVTRQDLAEFPNVNFSDPRVIWADMSGDGLQDIALVYDGNIEFWPNLGYGNWGKRISMRHSPRFRYGYDPTRVLAGDIDGDGLADLVYVDHRSVTLWINQSGNGWSDPITIHGTPGVTDMDAVSLVDLLGHGTPGVLWSAAANGAGSDHLSFLDFTGGLKPYLLQAIDNHLGAVTRVEYAPSTRFCLADQARPESRWQTPLPFPVQVVSRVEVIDALSGGKLTTEYSYHHGYWDGAEREFRGFGRVDQRDTEVFAEYHTAGLHENRRFAAIPSNAYSPPTETRTWFHLGPVGDALGDWQEVDFSREFWPEDPQLLDRPASMTELLQSLPRQARRDAWRTLRGRSLRTELYTVDGHEQSGRPYTVTEQLHGLREEEPPTGIDDGDRQRVFFPHQLAQRVTQWERGDDPLTQFRFIDDFDEFGQSQRQTQVACPRGWRRLADTPHQSYLATRSRTIYARPVDPQVLIMDRVAGTTTHEIENDGSQSVLDLRDLPDDASALKVIGQAIHCYDGDAYTGLPHGTVGIHGALTRTETLVLDEVLLEEAYDEVPPYLASDGPPVWTSEYPQQFRDSLPVDGPSDPTRPGLIITPVGYGFAHGSQDSPFERGYFVASERRRYDFHDSQEGTGRGVLKTTRDPLGHDTTISYDNFDLLPISVTDPAGLTTEALHDYRVLRPREVTDPNGNRQTFGFTPLGLPARIAVVDKNGQGDTQDHPGTRFEYDYLAFDNSSPENPQPISVRTIQRVHHANETDVPPEERDETIETIEYSDGFGRLLQTRTQAEDVVFGDPVFGQQIGLPADQSLPVGDAVGQSLTAAELPRVVVSGWKIYDNKGRIVEQYEPFFSAGWQYALPEDEQFGQKATMFYDPRGQLIRTVNPDGSVRRVVPGIPLDLADPERFAPTPWESYTYDENDNAGRSHPDNALAYANHWNTPSNVLVDALGRTVETVERNGSDPDADRFTTRSSYDIRGNMLNVTDALGRVAIRYTYDLAGQTLRTESIDAGIHRTMLDAAGNQVEARDSKGALTLHAYDALGRPTRLWARDGAGHALTLRERMVYGDDSDSGLDPTQAAAGNLLGKLYRHYDEAGLLTLDTYDFKGNLLEKNRRVISDERILRVFPSPDDPTPDWQVGALRVDWQPPAGTPQSTHDDALLAPTVYRTSTTYDALSRVKTLRYPGDVAGACQELRPHYNRAGALEHVRLGDDIYVEHIAYNAKGQRTLVALGNGVMTRYAYDRRTFRLARLRSERYTIQKPDTLRFHPIGAPLQDMAYAYDLTGNVTAIHGRSPGSGIPGRPLGVDALDRAFTYDPLYRLRSATGRECDRPPDRPPWDDRPRCLDLTRARTYTEQYQYDPVGSLVQLDHQSNGARFTRQLAPAPDSNRLLTLTSGQTVHHYTYDANGNLIQENTARHFAWDHRNQMKVFRTQVKDEEPSIHVHYLYDESGQRVKKLVRKQGGLIETTVYIDGLFEHHRIVQGTTTKENNTLHVMDDEARIAMLRVGDPFPDDTTPSVKYHLGDHLGSSNVVIDATGTLINREDYTPYGETSFGSFARKRYRFTGKERDEESGLYYHGARYYAPWVGRWMCPDPLWSMAEPNLYAYVAGNPLNFIDPEGTQKMDLGGGLIVQQNDNGDYTVIEGGYWVRNSYEKDVVEIQLNEKISARNRVALDRLYEEHGAAAINFVLEHAGVDIREDLWAKIMMGFAGGLGGLVSPGGGGRARIMGSPAPKPTLQESRPGSRPRRVRGTRSSETTEYKPVNLNRRWRVGDPHDAWVRGREPSWSTVRARYWKNRAASARPGEFSPENLKLMRQGKARRDPITGNTIELEHVQPQRTNLPGRHKALMEVTALEHAFFDPFRKAVDSVGESWVWTYLDGR